MTSAREALTLYYCVLDYVVFSSSQRARLYWLRGRTDRLSRFYSSRVASISTSIYIYIYIYIYARLLCRSTVEYIVVFVSLFFLVEV